MGPQTESRIPRNPSDTAAVSFRATSRPGLRRSVVKPYVVLYRTQGDVVRIERVLHGMRDLPSLIDDRTGHTSPTHT